MARMRPSQPLLWVVYALIFVVFLYAVKTLHEAPKTVPPQWKKY
eukprot:COSAG01_NODE_17807_length_1122_cov_3.911046_1_plen_43_part_10